MKTTDFILESNGALPDVYIHNTSPENAENIKQNGFNDSDYGVFFNVTDGSYSGGGYGDGIVKAKFVDDMPVDKLLDADEPTARDNEAFKKFSGDPEGIDSEAFDDMLEDGDMIDKFCRRFGYWAWKDGLQIAVINTKAIIVL